MNRRTLLFIFAMTATLFLMNQWFDTSKSSVGPSAIEQPVTEVRITDNSLVGKPLSDAEMKKYSVMMLYEDINLQQPVGYGVKQDNGYLGIAQSTDLPDQIYVRSLDEGPRDVLRADLRVSPDKEGELFYYSQYPLSKLEVPWIPEEGEFDVALLYFEGNKVYKIDGKTTGAKELKLNGRPPINGLVLFEFEKEIDPYAVYNAKSETLFYLDHLSALSSYSLLIYPQDSQLAEEYKDQKYYILENGYAQYVFTNINGAVAEINLPFESEKNPDSIVKPIEFDRILERDYPLNTRFPQYLYLTPGSTETKKPRSGGYYPLIRRNLIGGAGDTTTRINPHYYAFNIFEKDLSPDDYDYKVTRFEKDLIEFQLSSDKRRITKTFRLPKEGSKAPYMLDLDIKIEGDTRNLFLSLGIPEVDLVSGSFDPTLKYRATQNGKGVIKKLSPPKDFIYYSNVLGDWYTDGNAFFGIIFDPTTVKPQGLAVHPVSGELVPSRITIVDASVNKYPADKYPGYAMHIPLSSKTGSAKYRIYTGPYDKKILQLLDKTYTDKQTGKNPDYVAAKNYHGWFAFISQPFGQFLFIILNFFHSITHSWGFSIILLTVVLRLMLFPLNNWAMKSTAKMQKIQPQVKAIQEKYKKDPKRMQMETLNLYRKEGANPLKGCFPMLIQLPFLFGMLDLLKSSFRLRGATFIPGWIDNLTAPDVLFSWKYPLPFIGNQFHLLPIILGGIMFVQQKFMNPSASGPATTDQQKQQRATGNIMTVVFTILFYRFPSGLNIYWISSMLLGILQQWIVNKQIKAKGQ